MPNLIGQRLGNYCLIRYVGGGGFADVYLGEHLHLKILAAIKVLHARLSEKEMELFCQEARTIAHLAHPHIVRVLDFGVEEKMPFLVMEYAPNGTLRERHPMGERVPLPTIVSYVKQVAGALQHAHDHGIIHRDVKPANLLLGRQHEVVLSDFGTAMVAHSFRSGGPVETAGTILYMAPEQIQQSARRASDQYALGVMVYEWLCGGLPFRGTYFEVAAKHCQVAPPPLREKQPSISVEVEQVVLKALAKDPEERFESVQTFATELERASRGNRSPSLRPLQVIAALTQLHPLPHNGKSVREGDNQAATSPERAQGLRRAGQQQSSSVPAVSHLSARDRENRLRLLKRVRTTWIEGALEHSLHQAAMIALDLQERPDALANPGQLVVQETNLPPRTLPNGTSIVEVYDQAEGKLLLLGEPGAGKTTLLLELAKTLLQRGEQEEDHRLPVVFNLSSWANKQLPLSEWLVEELHSKYQVPRKLGQAWISTDQVLPLLDGLDEVAEHARSACVEVINAYYQHRLEQGPTPLVVCCRSQEYLALSTRVSLHQAVSIQPLTDEQIHHYVQSAGGRLEALQQAWRTDPELYNLAHRPLMLSIFTLAYQGAHYSRTCFGGGGRKREGYAQAVRARSDRIATLQRPALSERWSDVH